MLIGRNPSFAGDTPVAAYWLAHCHGFAVRGRRRSGIVEDVLFREAAGQAAYLSVRVRGLIASRCRPIAISEIAEVDPWSETIRLRSTIRACARRTRRLRR